MIKSKWLINLDEDITATAIDNGKTFLGSCPDSLTNIKVRSPFNARFEDIY